MIIRIEDEGKPIMVIVALKKKAVNGDDNQYDISEVIHSKMAGNYKPAAVKIFGVMTRQADETDKTFALRIFQKTMERK
jgi:hypothetical protein